MAGNNPLDDPEIAAAVGGSATTPVAANTAGTDDPEIAEAIRQAKTGGVSPKKTSFAQAVSSQADTDIAEAEGLSRGAIGAGEYALNKATGTLAGIVLPPNATDLQREFTYQPRSPEGRALMSARDWGYTHTHLGAFAREQGVNYSPELLRSVDLAEDLAIGGVMRGDPAYQPGGALYRAPTGIGATPIPNPFSNAPPTSAFAGSPQSVGAASATGAPGQVASLSPDLQAAATKLRPENVNPEVFARHAEADSLPVPMRLSEGQATGDPAIISRELNNRGATGFGNFLNKQNRDLVDNIQAIRDNAGPDVFTTNPVEHGDTLIAAYKAKDAAAQAEIAAKYQALRDANGGAFPIDAPTLKANVDAALHDKLLYEHAPSQEMAQLAKFADKGSMTFEQYEAMRTNLARVMRGTNPDAGNLRAAAGIIRDQMEALPLAGDAAKLKPLADSARAAARAQFQALDADPAYKAAVNDTVPPDRFVSRFIVNGDRDNVATMRANLADNPEATQTMGVAAVDHLRQQAGIDPMGNGTFTQAGFNRHLQKLAPKLSSLVEPEQAQQLERLGNVARYSQYQPKGSTVNTSGTLSGAIAQGLASTAEGAANVAAKGVPVGTWVRKGLTARALRRELETATAPLAGVEHPLGPPPRQ